MRRVLTSLAAFSLVELTLAIGIAAFCLITIIGLIPVGVQTNRNATSQTDERRMSWLPWSPTCDRPRRTRFYFGAIWDYDSKRSRFRGRPDLPALCRVLEQLKRRQNTSTVQAKVVASTAALYRVTLTLVQNPTATAATGALFYDVRATWPAQADPCATTPSGSVEMLAALR